ncbi:helix-turn-helix domain-containing protein [Endozoicomonas sp. SM1973]|uniref:Helix-turn-helix domain-containing protein n=1 Tax=Spartinivicinus marinus TaxID=2994442 RepID=A0A853I818_9GAMM|nr:YdaS family helix-turn-helix protein [Spartinivicinus marinus]MCX4025077.1 YdaS family helix-turn-helix protein [Spartinivicinus marinus]NYZ68969.1 helix-turn-helix domain-containing protein [Spartinivicinus marinus]
MTAIERAVELVGGQTALARLIGIQQSNVWHWLNRHNQVPAKFIRAVSKATNGLVTVDELLDDHEKTNK